jgi:hypothetical protein
MYMEINTSVKISDNDPYNKVENTNNNSILMEILNTTETRDKPKFYHTNQKIYWSRGVK